MKFNKVAIVGKSASSKIVPHVVRLAKHLFSKGIEVYLDKQIVNEGSNSLPELPGVSLGYLAEWLENLDLVIVIGGDGTLLSVGRAVVDFEVPVLGVNQGQLGFMTDVAIDDMLPEIDKILVEGKYTLGQRVSFIANVIRDGDTIFKGVALNDVVISRGAIGNMIEFDLSINEQFVLSQKSDGIIFTTPTGSTAYALAAGGPILQPNAGVFGIVPICPQSLSNRPFVINDSSKIELTLTRDNSTQIHFDGQECFSLNYQDKVRLYKHPKLLRFIHPEDYNYYSTLRQKLHWSRRVS